LRQALVHPANHPWERTWTEYSHADLDDDFAKISSLGRNAVRLILFPEVMGFSTNSVPAAMAANLRDAIDTAVARGLSVQFTLFDSPSFIDPTTGARRFYADQLPLTNTWLTKLLSGYSGDSRIALVELQNELNLSDPSNPALETWANSTLAYLPTLLPGVPRTADTAGSSDGSTEANLINRLNSGLDVLDVDLYGSPSENTAVLRSVSPLASGRPIIGCTIRFHFWDKLLSVWSGVALSAVRCARPQHSN